MPSWLKVVLIVIAILVLILIGFGVAGYFYVKQHKQEWSQATEAATREGEAFAQGKNESQCVDEAVSRIAKCGPLPCELVTREFMNSCLQKAARSPEVCNGVPSDSNIIATAKWAVEECGRRGQPGSQTCTRLLQDLSEYCTPHK